MSFVDGSTGSCIDPNAVSCCETNDECPDFGSCVKVDPNGTTSNLCASFDFPDVCAFTEGCGWHSCFKGVDSTLGVVTQEDFARGDCDCDGVPNVEDCAPCNPDLGFCTALDGGPAGDSGLLDGGALDGSVLDGGNVTKDASTFVDASVARDASTFVDASVARDAAPGDAGRSRDAAAVPDAFIEPPSPPPFASRQPHRLQGGGGCGVAHVPGSAGAWWLLVAVTVFRRRRR